MEPAPAPRPLRANRFFAAQAQYISDLLWMSMTKAQLRAQMLETRRSLTFEEVYRRSALVQGCFLATGFYVRARRLALYASFRNEVLTDEVFQNAGTAGKDVLYPRVVKGAVRRVAFFKVGHLGELANGSYEIKEPETREVEVSLDALDLVVVPGLAFDMSGHRLGYGKGYYDIALSRVRCPVVALAYDFQVLDELLPCEPHDVKVSAIATETRVIIIDPVR